MTVVTANAGSDECWPPGFRFHPTDEELVLYYLKKKICRRKIKLDIIRELDVYKRDPEELPGQSMLKTGDRQWFFFSPRDRKYPNGARSNRATQKGYWKATGKDRTITCNSRNVGVKKTLVFYRGRAPSGERTNWVMHEYTLDEEELKRCPNVKDYFALYKVYKKSGAGPKNGEQYGAPFREEDWAEDYPEFNVPVITDSSVKKQNDVAPIDNAEADGQVVPPLSDLELDETLKKIADESLFEQHQISDQNYLLPQVVGEEESQSTLVDPSNRDFGFQEPMNGLAPISQLHDKQATVEFNYAGNSALQSHEASEVTSAPENSQQAIHFAEEDFLEIDDLLEPEPTLSVGSKPLENLGFDDFEGLSHFDLYHDAQMFFHEMESVDPEPILHQQMNFIGNEPVNQVGSQLQQHHVADQIGDQLQPLLFSDLDYQLQPQFIGAGQISNQPILNDQRSNIVSSSELNFVTQPPSGDVCQYIKNPDGPIQNQTSNEDGGATWISSTLWSFVESIPTTPASAAESPLVNKALERMSSFSRLRMNVKNTNVAAGNVATNVRATSRNRGIIFLSVIGVLCAILWVFVGSARVLGRSISW